MNQAVKMAAPFACPRCHTELVQRHDELWCDQCGDKWPIESGIPRFSKDDTYWGEIPKQLMETIVKCAASEGWRTAAKKYLSGKYKDLQPYVFEENRADWRFLLPLGASKTVLDLGAGWGLISHLLAKSSGTVWALEKIAQRVEFLRLRFQQERVANVRIVQADFLELPFSDHYFDAVICNGILEWVGLHSVEKSPRHAQLAFLKRLVELLKPNGNVYIGIENRFGYPQLLGRKDHSGLRFTSVVPRFAANWITRLFNRGDNFYLSHHQRRGYRTYTYTASGFRKLLTEAGFEFHEIYYVFPDYNYPRWLIPAESETVYEYFFQNIFLPFSNRGRVLRQIATIPFLANALRFTMPAFCIILRRPEAMPKK